LAVDDNFEALQLIRSYLREIPVAQVYTAKDGKEAMDFLGSCDDLVDVVLCDWNMPRVSGIDLLKQVRTVDPNMPFLMITGAADLASVTEAKAAGVSGYVAKPYSADQLRKKLLVIARVVAHRQQMAA
jgi:CheY-like chemotaxis protein